ncbi:putative DNA-binding domain-containing protein [Kitasatospora sp. NPDC058397]|uniref:HvfC/BufC family peptide modification chaperone n=1 Tax=unclassified Kitasatospora TaxID=2633591 RepID=UPI00364B9F94
MSTVEGAPAHLAELQHWLQAAVLHATGPDQEGGAAADQVLTPSGRLTAGERLDIYRRGYRLRLLACLRSCFPALRRLLGPEAFDALATEYLSTCPPRSWTLEHFADGFASHLATTRPDLDPPGRDVDPWVQLIVELAGYERAFVEVYDAEPARACRVLACRHPVHRYAAAVARGEDPQPPAARPVLLLLRRRDHGVHVTELTEDVRRTLLASSNTEHPDTEHPDRPDRAGPPSALPRLPALPTPPAPPSPRPERPEPNGAEV